jgi:hypothetical protein
MSVMPESSTSLCHELGGLSFPAVFGLLQQGIIYSFVGSFCARRTQKLPTKKMVYHLNLI